MRYMLLVHHDEITFRERSESEREVLMRESVALANQLHRDGKYLGAAPLHPTAETMCVQVREGRRIVTDGPFAETREQLGGYFLVDFDAGKPRNHLLGGFRRVALKAYLFADLDAVAQRGVLSGRQSPVWGVRQ